VVPVDSALRHHVAVEKFHVGRRNFGNAFFFQAESEGSFETQVDLSEAEQTTVSSCDSNYMYIWSLARNFGLTQVVNNQRFVLFLNATASKIHFSRGWHVSPLSHLNNVSCIIFITWGRFYLWYQNCSTGIRIKICSIFYSPIIANLDRGMHM